MLSFSKWLKLFIKGMEERKTTGRFFTVAHLIAKINRIHTIDKNI